MSTYSGRLEATQSEQSRERGSEWPEVDSSDLARAGGPVPGVPAAADNTPECGETW